MLVAIESRLALAALVVAPELAVPFFLHMVVGKLTEAEAMTRRKRRKKMSSMGGIKSENKRALLFIMRNDWGSWPLFWHHGKMDKDPVVHVSRREINRCPITPTTCGNRGGASVNAQGLVIS
jgi:hypothetical protein